MRGAEGNLRPYRDPRLSLAKSQGLHTVLIRDDAEDSDLRRTDWVLVAKNPKVLKHP